VRALDELDGVLTVHDPERSGARRLVLDGSFRPTGQVRYA
jgi:hypothetical protein